MNEYERLDRTLEHHGVIVDFYTDLVRLPNGNTARWDFIDHHGAAAIIPVLQDGRILTVRQYRNAPEQYTIEIPAGGLEPGEDPLTCAARECEEETGYKPAGEVKHLLDLYPTVAYCNEVISVYYTEGLLPSHQHLDPDEFIDVTPRSMDEMVDLILSGKIIDSKTIASILAYRTLKEKEAKN